MQSYNISGLNKMTWNACCCNDSSACSPPSASPSDCESLLGFVDAPRTGVSLSEDSPCSFLLLCSLLGRGPRRETVAIHLERTNNRDTSKAELQKVDDTIEILLFLAYKMYTVDTNF